MWGYVSIAIFLCVVSGGFGQNPTATPLEAMCNIRNNSNCDLCLQVQLPPNTGICYWCQATQKCSHFSANTAFFLDGIPCPNLEYNAGTCALTALIIAILIALGLLLVIVMITCVCCCCCIWCAQRRKRSRIIEENRYMDEKESIRQRSAERRQERKAKNDEIRRKYGLDTDTSYDGKYKKMES